MSEEPPVDPPTSPSKVPSWIMVGFVFGVLVTVTWRRERPAPATVDPAKQQSTESAPAAPPPDPATEVNALRLEDEPSLSMVEALFEEYRGYAFWEDDRTEIGVWNTRTLTFADKFEVLRADTGTYFRSIRTFTRLPLEKYGPPDSPILFTETATQRAARYLETRGQVPKSLPPPPTPELPRIVPQRDAPPR